jgi:hypothetical protein
MTESKKAFTDQLRQALAKKHAAQHPDQKTQDGKSLPRAGAPVANKPQKRVTGRGR